MSRLVHVAAAVIRRADGAVLIARRPQHVHQGGLWEFPGGKLESGESTEQALRRELDEELGIGVVEGSGRNHPLIQIYHDYGDKQVLLDVWQVADFRGEPRGREGQPLVWVAPDELPRYPFPAANLPIILAARLPHRYLITGDFASFADFEARLLRALGQGIRLVQLRAKSLSRNEYRDLARVALAHCRRHGAHLLLNSDPDMVSEVGADGLHLSSGALMELEARPIPRGLWLAASCHGPEELAQAQRIGVDFALLSPVCATASHPETAPLGWDAFAAFCRNLKLPVFALGGLGEQDLDLAWRHGGQGVAAIRAWWEAR